MEGYRIPHCSCTVSNVNLTKDKTTIQTETNGVYSGCFMLNEQVVTKQMYKNKFETKICNVGINVGHQVMAREYI